MKTLSTGTLDDTVWSIKDLFYKTASLILIKCLEITMQVFPFSRETTTAGLYRRLGLHLWNFWLR